MQTNEQIYWIEIYQLWRNERKSKLSYTNDLNVMIQFHLISFSYQNVNWSHLKCRTNNALFNCMNIKKIGSGFAFTARVQNRVHNQVKWMQNMRFLSAVSQNVSLSSVNKTFWMEYFIRNISLSILLFLWKWSSLIAVPTICYSPLEQQQ